ncbi:MAG: hypothetical protein ABJM26_20505 [Anderseniella sp.]|uniref:hypothetical protein n=1 Tax=Marinobacter sp. TaxID=50741 RepID=UPI003271EB06
MNSDDFKNALLGNEAEEICQQMMSRDTNWYFDESGEVAVEGGYSTFRSAVAKQLEIEAPQTCLVGSSVYGFSLSPNAAKTFCVFHENSDLDLMIVSEPLFRAIWSELLEAYHRGYRWIIRRHADQIFRQFTLLINNGNYGTSLLRKRTKILDGISKEVFLQTGSSRSIKYRIYETERAAMAYHSSGLAKIKRRLENDAK